MTPAFAAKPKTDTAAHEPIRTAAHAPAKQRLVAPQATKSAGHAAPIGTAKTAKMRYVSGPGISCVPYARLASGITVKGNAANWWANAAGLYERGYRPEAGSVLNFRATGRMRLGHVAVVTQVVNAREVIIDHANWGGPGLHKGMVSKGVPVIDVSENNDWSAVRVALSGSGTFGSVYPTYGFIYDRPDRGSMLANTLGRTTPRYEEVAEAPSAPVRARR